MANGNFDDVFSVIINGQNHTGWQSVRTRSAIDSIARGFTVQMAFDEEGDYPLLVEGAECLIMVNDTLYVTGEIEEISERGTSEEETRTIVGRSKTKDIVDCSVVLDTNQINNQTPYQICKRIAKTFGIDVINDAPSQRQIPIFRWSDNARAGGVMQEACYQQGLTIRDNEKGQLVITRPTNRPLMGALSTGDGTKDNKSGNIETFNVRRSNARRYSEYIFKGRTSQGNGKSANQISAKAFDTGINSYRPLIVQLEEDVDYNIAKRRAVHEANVRIAQSYSVSASTSGWRRMASGEPWRVDTLASVSIPKKGVDEDMLIRELILDRDESGTTASIELVNPASFDAEPSATRSGKKIDTKSNKPVGIVKDLGAARKFGDFGTN